MVDEKVDASSVSGDDQVACFPYDGGTVISTARSAWSGPTGAERGVHPADVAVRRGDYAGSVRSWVLLEATSDVRIYGTAMEDSVEVVQIERLGAQWELAARRSCNELRLVMGDRIGLVVGLDRHSYPLRAELTQLRLRFEERCLDLTDLEVTLVESSEAVVATATIPVSAAAEEQSLCSDPDARDPVVVELAGELGGRALIDGGIDLLGFEQPPGLVATTRFDVLRQSIDALPYYGSVTESAEVRSPIVAIEATATGQGYWQGTADGGVFAFGDAGYLGSMGGVVLNSPVVGMAVTPSGLGYWLVASDGGVFAFGDAGYLGSMGGVVLNSPVVGMAVTPSGLGYWLVASDGGVFAFGDAGYLGSMGGVVLNSPVVGMAATPSGDGYLLLRREGTLAFFGDSTDHGQLTYYGSVATSVAMLPGGGYAVLFEEGDVQLFGVGSTGIALIDGFYFDGLLSFGVDMAVDPLGRGLWVARGGAPFAPQSVRTCLEDPKRHIETRIDGQPAAAMRQEDLIALLRERLVPELPDPMHWTLFQEGFVADDSGRWVLDVNLHRPSPGVVLYQANQLEECAG